MEKNARIYIADQEGLVGNALRCEIKGAGYANPLFEVSGPTLTDFAAVDEFFAKCRPEYVFLVGVLAPIEY